MVKVYVKATCRTFQDANQARAHGLTSQGHNSPAGCRVVLDAPSITSIMCDMHAVCEKRPLDKSWPFRQTLESILDKVELKRLPSD